MMSILKKLFGKRDDGTADAPSSPPPKKSSVPVKAGVGDGTAETEGESGEHLTAESAGELRRILLKGIENDRDGEFFQLFLSMSAGQVTDDIAAVVTEIYGSTKDTHTKNQCLKLLFAKDYPFLEAFFRQAYSRCRYLNMKMNALRGLAQFVTEEEVAKRLEKFNVSLRKRPASTPYNYQEYELLRGEHALPFLINRYGYACLQETLDIVNSQYDAMPDAFKGHFTTDESGMVVMLRSSEEAGKMMTAFFEEQQKAK